MLEFNKWHIVELIFGNIARFDTYLDVCFLSLIASCYRADPAQSDYSSSKYPSTDYGKSTYPSTDYAASKPDYPAAKDPTGGYRLLGEGPIVFGYEPMLPYVLFFGILFLTFPFFSLWRLSGIREDKGFKHALPTIERCSKLAFIRENMLLATVLDSFCISNNMEIFKKFTITTGRAMAFWTAFTQDFPQYIIHILFVAYVFKSGVSHDDPTVIMSLAISSIAVGISAFNIIMCGPNEFDPMIVELELKKRKEADEMIDKAKKWMIERFKAAFVRPKSVLSPSPLVSRQQSAKNDEPMIQMTQVVPVANLGSDQDFEPNDANAVLLNDNQYTEREKENFSSKGSTESLIKIQQSRSMNNMGIMA